MQKKYLPRNGEKKISHKKENVFCENKNPKIISEKQHFNTFC